ncbi:hypothetical protein [Streptomyces sp. 4F14]|uniref:hypothetical protein n=1 Tax=Streptomyces sp. 4F14 TaxID=3394380 RepID=UPI003A882862
MNVKRKVTMAVLTGAAVLGGLAAPATASAADKFAQIQLCNHSNEQVKFFIVGGNQHQEWGGSRFWEAAPHTCALAKDYWWKLGESVELHHRKPSTGWRTDLRLLPANGNPNGSTVTLVIG